MRNVSVWSRLVVQFANEIIELFLNFIIMLKDRWVRGGEPFKNLILSLEEVCIWVLELWAMNNEHRYEHFCF